MVASRVLPDEEGILPVEIIEGMNRIHRGQGVPEGLVRTVIERFGVNHNPESPHAVAGEHGEVYSLRLRQRTSGLRQCWQTWKCPDCDRTTEHSYEALAEVGTPICTGCDTQMELM
jgi:ribosomal protein L37AE/L43A